MGKQASLRSGAQVLLRLLKDIANSPCRDVPDGEDSHDYVANARMIEESILENLFRASGPHRDGYLRALTDVLAMAADGFCPADEWDPIANTSAAFRAKPNLPRERPSPAPTFFSLNADYLIAPNACLVDLGNDVACLLEASCAVYEKQIADDESCFAGLYALRQAKAVFEELNRRLPAEAIHG